MAFGVLISGAAILAFVILLGWAAINDARHYEIPNWLCIAIVGLFPAYALGNGLQSTPLSLTDHLWVAGVSFLVCFGLFAAGVMGGGDAKLIPAVSLWAGSGLMAKFLLIMAACGGVVALGLFAWTKLKRDRMSAAAREARAFLRKPGTTPLPYGIAIATGGIAVALELWRSNPNATSPLGA